MATITNELFLAQCQAALLALLTSGAQSYTINGRTYTRYDIDALTSAITWLEARIDAASQPGIGGTILAQTPNMT